MWEMNRGPFYLLPFVLLLASCQREQDWGGAPDIEAKVESEQKTRTSLSVDESGAGTIYWNQSDKIDVFFGTKKVQYTSQNSSDATTATFKTSETVSGSDVFMNNIWGLYPSNSSSSCNGSSVTTELPSTQFGVPGTFDDDLFLSLAHSSSTSLQFYNVCGGIKFSLARDDIESITFKGNNNENIAGWINLSFSGGRPKATVVSAYNTITITPKQGQTFAPDTFYYLVTLPVTLSKGFTMTYVTRFGEEGILNYTDSSVSLKRSVFSTKSRIDSYADLNGGIDFYRTIDMGAFKFSCDGYSLQVDGSDAASIYEFLGMTKETFQRLYPVFSMDGGEDGYTVSFDPDTFTIQWNATAEWLWRTAASVEDYHGEYELTTDVYFLNPNNGNKVIVTLRAVPALIRPFNIPLERYVRTYWNEDVTATQYCAAVPNDDDTNSALCVFHNNINLPFLRDEKGVIDLGEHQMGSYTLPAVGDPSLEVSNINYFFCPEMEQVTRIGEYVVRFTVMNDGLELWAAISGGNAVRIATIDNTSTETPFAPNIVILENDPDPNHPAKLLLNTDELFIYLGATGLVCGDEGFEVNLFWQNCYDYTYVDHFRADYIQPVRFSDTANSSFIDGVDLGQEGSYIPVRELFSLMDWRERVFGRTESENYYNYWQYYGVNGVYLDLDYTMTILRGAAGEFANSIELVMMSKDELLSSVSDPAAMATIDAIDDGGFGFLTLRNNGSPATSDYELNIPIAVQYAWGELREVFTVPCLSQDVITPKAVDLGLSVKWASCNVGASSPEEYGDYFAWGETSPKSRYEVATYRWCNGDMNSILKYNSINSVGTVDNKTVLDFSDDVAHVKWGESWRMPTETELKELLDNCTWTWVVQNGKNGCKVTSNLNGNSIFLPAAGFYNGAHLMNGGTYGYYWTSMMEVDYPAWAWLGIFNSSESYKGGGSRYQGRSVRPVWDQ